MDVFHSHELTLITALQTLRSPSLDTFFIALNMFDRGFTYLIIIVLLWYFVSEKAGFTLLYLLAISSALCDALKAFCAQPRPYELLPTLKIVGTHGYGFPSGAATSICVTVGFIFFVVVPAKHFTKIAAASLILLVGLTRIYVGAHFISDVLGGYAVGIAVLVLYAYLLPFFKKKIKHLSVWSQMSIHSIFIFCLILMHVSLHSLFFLTALFGAVVWHLFFQPRFYAMRHYFLVCKCIAALSALLGVFFLGVFSKALPHSSSIPDIVRIMLFFMMGIWLGAAAIVPYCICRAHNQHKADH